MTFHLDMFLTLILPIVHSQLIRLQQFQALQSLDFATLFVPVTFLKDLHQLQKLTHKAQLNFRIVQQVVYLLINFKPLHKFWDICKLSTVAQGSLKRRNILCSVM